MGSNGILWWFNGVLWDLMGFMGFTRNGKHRKNHGKIHPFQWVNPLFWLGHFQQQTVNVYQRVVSVRFIVWLPNFSMAKLHQFLRSSRQDLDGIRHSKMSASSGTAWNDMCIHVLHCGINRWVYSMKGFDFVKDGHHFWFVHLIYLRPGRSQTSQVSFGPGREMPKRASLLFLCKTSWARPRADSWHRRFHGYPVAPTW